MLKLMRLLTRCLRTVSGRFLLWQSGAFAGARVEIAPHVRLRATDGGTIEIGDGVAIDRFADVMAKRGQLDIGMRTYIGQFSVVCARASITVGTDCLIAEHVTIRDQDHRFGPGLITAQSGFKTAPIAIGNNVWIGANATITKGVTIGDNAVIGANAVVTRNVPADCVAIGVPAKIARKIATV